MHNTHFYPQVGYPYPQNGYNQIPQGYYYPQDGYPYPQNGYNQIPQGYYYPQDGYPYQQADYNQIPQGYYYPQVSYPYQQAGYDQTQYDDQELSPVEGEDVESAPINLTTQSSGFPNEVAFPFLSDHSILSYGVHVKNPENQNLAKLRVYSWNRGNRGIKSDQGYYNNPFNVIEEESQYKERMRQQYEKILYIIDKDPKVSIFLLQESFDLYNGSEEFTKNLAERNWKIVLFSRSDRVKFNALIYNEDQMTLTNTREIDIYRRNNLKNHYYNTLIGNFKLKKFNDLEIEIGSVHFQKCEHTEKKVKKLIESFRNSDPKKSALFLGGDTNFTKKSKSRCFYTYYIGNSEFLDHIPTLHPNSTNSIRVKFSGRINFSLGTPNQTTDNIMIITEKRFTSFLIEFVENEGKEEAKIEQRQINPKIQYRQSYKHTSMYRGCPIRNERNMSRIQIRE